MADDRRSGPRRRWRTFTALRPEEKHDRHAGREKYLSGRYREHVRGASREGIFRLRGELHLATTHDGRRATRVGAPSRAGAERRWRTARGNFPPQCTAFELQANRGIRDLGTRLSSQCRFENQAHGPCRADRQTTRSQRDGCLVNERYFAIVNPAAGSGRCGKLAPAALERLRSAGLDIEVRKTRAPGEAVVFANSAYAEGYRNFIAVGGDGTGFEIVNGLFPAAALEGRAALGFLPLGTGNSFLRDFTERGADYAIEAIRTRRRRPCDVIRLNHAGGTLFYINTLNIGFAADVATLTNRHLKRLGELGYLAGVLVSLARLRRRSFPLRADGERDDRRCLFLAFSNSKYTGGKMMIAPQASIGSGAIIILPPVY